MTWAKQIDRTKFARDGMVVASFDKKCRVWRCAIFGEGVPDDDPLAVGEGRDPLEAMLSMCVALGAIADTGEWVGV